MKRSWFRVLLLIFCVTTLLNCSVGTVSPVTLKADRGLQSKVEEVRALRLDRILVMRQREGSDNLDLVGSITDAQLVESLLNALEAAPTQPSRRVQFGPESYVVVASNDRAGFGLVIPNFQLPPGEVPSSFQRTVLGDWQVAEQDDFSWPSGNVLCINWEDAKLREVWDILHRVDAKP